MSSNSLENPFYHPDQRTGIPSKLTEVFLDPATNTALTEALGEDEPSKPEPQLDLPPVLDISMSGKEQREVEDETIWSRQKYIDWAESFGKDESWVDEIFTFQKNGTTVVERDLNLEKTGIVCLPIGLMKVKGNLRISQNPSLKLNGYPKKVGGNFVCYATNLFSFHGMPEEIGGKIILNNNKFCSLIGSSKKVNNHLDLSYNQLENLNGISREISGSLDLDNNKQLTSLEALKGTKIDGFLVLSNIPATEIPAGIEIGGVIYIRKYQTALIADAERKGYQVEIS